MKTPLWARLLPLRALHDAKFVPFALSLLFFFLSLTAVTLPLNDPDGYWIATGGRYLLEHGALPRQNLWSITDADVPWVFHEWLLGPFYAWLLPHVEGRVLFVAHGIVGAWCSFALAIGLAFGRARYLASAVSSTLVAAWIGRGAMFSARPSCTLFVLWLIALAQFLTPTFSRRALAGSVLLSVFWANAHGSAPIGVGLLFLGLVVAWPERELDDEHRVSFRNRVIAFVASIVALLTTPNGLGLATLISRYVVGGDRAAQLIHEHIAEFSPLLSATHGFASPELVVAVCLVIILGLTELVRGVTRLRRASGLVLVTLGAMAFYQARHSFPAAMFGGVLAVPVLDELLVGARLAVTRAEEARLSARKAQVLSFVVAIGFVAASPWQAVYDRTLGDDDFEALIAELPEDAHLYAGFLSTGHALWLGVPRGLRILFDPRNDCYRAETIELAVQLEQGTLAPADAIAALEAAHVEHVIVVDDHAVNRVFAELGRQPVESRGRYRRYLVAPPNGS